MTQCWEPGTQYNPGDVVDYEGHCYKNIQGHRSQGDWTPPVTPALWGKMSGHSNDHQHDQHHDQQPVHQQQPYQAPPQYPSDDKHTQSQGQQSQSSDQKVEPKKNWIDEHKTEIGIGAGLAGGAALLAGGLFAYKHHEKSEDQAWAQSNWLSEAEKRTADFRQEGGRGPANWVLNRGTTIPPGAIEIGKEKSWTLYVCRAFLDASSVFKKGAVIGYKDEEHHLDTYEILVGDMRGLRWVSASGKLNVSSLGARPIEGGRENDGTPIYVVKAFHKGAEHPGKASEKLDGAFIAFGGEEEKIREYQVLCYA
ncbi:hypothetical protein B0H34DRAFT_782560 [Crassisporium funariophilum]|nr:hypothetical protein B0H34DRAFT_782560 [Crassisporium funariophilum]